MPDKPELEDAPGHVLRRRRDGQWTVFWQARSDIVERGFYPARQRIAVIGLSSSAAERERISDRCKGLQAEMLGWGRGKPGASFNGTIRSLIHCYQSDPDSPFRILRYESKNGYRRFLSRIEADHGDVFIAAIRGRQAKHWHDEWMKSGVAMAHGLISMLRTVITFGVTILDDPVVNAECLRVETILSKMRFTMAKPRVSVLAIEHVNAIRAKAHEMGMPSIALAQALQFDCMLRQRDVIGEWVPLSEPGISPVTWRGQKWLRGVHGRRSMQIVSCAM